MTATIDDLEALARRLWGDDIDTLDHAIRVYTYNVRSEYWWERYHSITYDLGGEG